MPRAPLSFWQRLTSSGLRARIALALLIVGVVPVLALSALALVLVDLSHRHDVSRLQLQLIASQREQIEKFMNDTRGILELRISSTERGTILLADQSFLLQGLLQENDAFLEVSFVDLEGQETAKQRREGAVIELTNVALLPHFQAAAAGESFVSTVHYTAQGPLVTMAAPVRNANGHLIQVLTAEVALSDLAQSVASTGLGASGYLVVFDHTGALVAGGGPATNRQGERFPASTRVQQATSGHSFDALAPQDRYHSFLNGTAVVGAAQPLPELGWTIMVEWPLDDADALLHDIRQQALWFTLLTILAVLVLVPLIASRLIKPIRELERGAEAVASGDFDHQVNIHTRDELEELGQAFNRMAAGLKRLQELKNEFVFVAAHELRTPVTGIKGYLSMLLAGELGQVDDKPKEILGRVAKANDRLVQLVNDLLEIARSDAGRLTVSVEPVSVTTSVNAILDETAPLSVEKELDVSYDPLVTLPTVLADEIRLKEVLMNFISNGIKYNRTGGTLTITHEVTDAEVITHIADTGLGLSKEDQQHMFEKFWRSEAKEMREIGGTGLGMFITKELIEKMNGRVWFVSEKNKGTTFSFSLPRATIK